jgi:hypothetical protein
LVVGIVCVVLAGFVWGGVAFVRAIIDVPRRAYAVWWTADLVIEYMERHEGAWPRSWEELRALAEPAPSVTESKEPDGRVIVEFRPMASIDELKQLVEIDWDATPEKLLVEARKDGDSPFRVIYLRDGRTTHYEGREPNRMIMEYLESKQRRKEK